MGATDTKLVGGAPGACTFGLAEIECVVDVTFGAQRATLKPQEYNFQSFNGGHYRLAGSTGALTTVAGGAAIFSMRWATVGPIMILKRLQLAVAITTVFTTGQAIDFDVIAQRTFSASDSGGTALTPPGNNSQKMRSALMGSSQVADARISTTAALTAGTKTPDNAAFGICTIPNSNTLGSGAFVDLYKDDLMGGHPMVFGANEGFNIRPVTTMGAAGVIKVYIVAEWCEAPGL